MTYENELCNVLFKSYVKALNNILLGSWLMKMNFEKKTLTCLKGSSVYFDG